LPLWASIGSLHLNRVVRRYACGSQRSTSPGPSSSPHLHCAVECAERSSTAAPCVANSSRCARNRNRQWRPYRRSNPSALALHHLCATVLRSKRCYTNSVIGPVRTSSVPHCAAVSSAIRPTQADYDSVVAFAKSQGFTVTRTYANRLLVNVSGSATNITRPSRSRCRSINARHRPEDTMAPMSSLL
jgi:hypothetical protein